MAGHPNALTPVQLDRAAGVLVAAAVGDALGAGYEFRSPCPPDEVQMLPGALTGRAAGSWTDDTDMAIAIARVAATGAHLEVAAGRAAVASGFAEWYTSNPPDIGNQTRAVLSTTPTEEAMPAAMEAAAADYQERHREAAGNGSLMRTGPVALTALGDDERLLASASAVSALTHPHAWARQACQLWCIAIDRAIREGRLDGINDGLALIEPEGSGYWHDAIAAAETMPIETLRRTNGFVVAALQSAWRAIVSTNDLSGPAHLEAALRAAVAIGGDTDTVAAIAGALLGGRYGASAVPFAWRRGLGGWPSDITHGDLVPLAILAANRGKADPAGWPLDHDLTAYYERTNHPIGLVGALPGHDGVLWGDVGGLAVAEAEAFVSLCRIGPGQRRDKEHHEVWLQDNSSNADPAFVLSDTADAIEWLRLEVGTVFVHCVRSESRTPTVAAAWLIRHRGLGADEAINLVRQSLRNAFTNHNPALLAALREVRPIAAEAHDERGTAVKQIPEPNYDEVLSWLQRKVTELEFKVMEMSNDGDRVAGTEARLAELEEKFQTLQPLKAVPKPYVVPPIVSAETILEALPIELQRALAEQNLDLAVAPERSDSSVRKGGVNDEVAQETARGLSRILQSAYEYELANTEDGHGMAGPALSWANELFEQLWGLGIWQLIPRGVDSLESVSDNDHDQTESSRRPRSNSGRQLNEEWHVGAKHALYHEPGTFYQNLTEFPGALFDGNGYVLFPTESEYLNAAGLKHGIKLNVHGGISSLEGYIKMR